MTDEGEWIGPERQQARTERARKATEYAVRICEAVLAEREQVVRSIIGELRSEDVYMRADVWSAIPSYVRATLRQLAPEGL